MVNFERDHEGIIKYVSELQGPLDGCSMEIVYFPEEFELAGLVQITLSDSVTKERVGRLKAKMELDKIEKNGSDYEVIAKFDLKEIEGGFGLVGGSNGVSTTSENYKLEMVMLCNWFMGQWMTKCRWDDFIFSSGEDSEWERKVDGWVGGSKMESFFGDGKANVKGGFGLAVEHIQMLSDGKGGWFSVGLETADGLAGEVRGILSKADIGVKWILSDDADWGILFADEAFEEAVSSFPIESGPGLSEVRKMCLYLGVRYLRQHYGKVGVLGAGGDHRTGEFRIDEKVLSEESSKWVGF